MLLSGFLPKLLAPKGYAGRERNIAAFQWYFAAEGHKTGSDLIQARYQVLQRGLDAEDVARFECVNGFAILLNSVPTAFWAIYHIFSDQELLSLVRQQVETVMALKEHDCKVYRVIDLAGLGQLPTLASNLQESLRIRTTGLGPQIVLKDVMLNDRYLLKKDSYVMIPNHEIHFDHQTWGNDTDTFDAQRFIRKAAKKVPSTAFRGFGGGANLFPGKSFAMAEIIAFIALLVTKFDLRPES